MKLFVYIYNITISYDVAMNLIDLKALVSVVEEGSATAAARQLHMTQPGITKHIQKLE